MDNESVIYITDFTIAGCDTRRMKHFIEGAAIVISLSILAPQTAIANDRLLWHGANLMDVVSTEAALSTGRFEEANPLAPNRAMRLVVSTGTTEGYRWAHRYAKRHGHKKTAVGIKVLYFGGKIAVTAINIKNARSSK